MKIFLFPGLGFDYRIFNKLELSQFDVQHLDWIEPQSNENFRSYALRFSERMIHQDEKMVIIGHSLGGMLAQEIASFKKIDTIILISSIKHESQNPFQFRIIKHLGLQHLFTKGFTLKTFPFWAKDHGYESKEEKDLFISMVSQYSNSYLKWALKQVSIWKKHEPLYPTRVIQIIGDRDKNFPFKNIKDAEHVIKGAGHFMVYKRSDILNGIILPILETQN